MSRDGLRLAEQIILAHEQGESDIPDDIVSGARRVIEMEEGYFPITGVSRADLADIGFSASELDEEIMLALSEKLGDAYLDSTYWIDLPICAEAVGIRKQKYCHQCGKPASFTNDLNEFFCDQHAWTRQDNIDQQVHELLCQEAGNPKLEWNVEQIANKRDATGVAAAYPYLIDSDPAATYAITLCPRDALVIPNEDNERALSIHVTEWINAHHAEILVHDLRIDKNGHRLRLGVSGDKALIVELSASLTTVWSGWHVSTRERMEVA